MRAASPALRFVGVGARLPVVPQTAGHADERAPHRLGRDAEHPGGPDDDVVDVAVFVDHRAVENVPTIAEILAEKGTDQRLALPAAKVLQTRFRDSLDPRFDPPADDVQCGNTDHDHRNARDPHRPPAHEVPQRPTDDAGNGL
jgi:hypothetical protein